MHIDAIKLEDGDAEDFLQCQVLGFCGCGAPGKSLRYIRDALRHTANLKKVWDKEMKWEEWDRYGMKLMGNAREFTRYWMDKEGLTEHGGGVGGAWLTEKGSKLRDDLDKLLSSGGDAELEGDAPIE